MKAIKLFSAAILVLATASSCKKEARPLPADNRPKISKIEATDGSYAMNFSYNGQGRLAETRDNSFIVKYAYPTGSFNYTIYNTSNVKGYDLADLSIQNGRVTYFNYRDFNASGEPSSSTPTTVEYDANGFQAKKSYESYSYITEVTGQNMTKLTKYSNGTQSQQISFEYYTDKQSKFNVNWFEFYYFDHILNDKELFGKQSANLLKKVTSQSASTTTVYEFSYVTDANGLVKEYTINTTKNGVAFAPYTYKLTWQ